MITSIQFTGGFPAKLPCLGTRVHQFKPGLNILFGPNGCGKSTIIKALAGRLGCYKGGFTRLLNGLTLQTGPGTLEQQMSRCNFSKHDVDCVIQTDGSRGFLYRGNEVTSEVAGHFFHDEADSPDGLTGVQEQLSAMMRRPSHGMIQQNKLFTVLGMLSRIPPQADLLKLRPMPSKLDTLQAELWTRDLAKVANREVLTIMLDEPDAHLEIPFQYMALLRLLPNLATKFQIVLATHNPIVLLLTDVHFVDLDPDYVATARRFMGQDLPTVQLLIEEYRHALHAKLSPPTPSPSNPVPPTLTKPKKTRKKA